MRRIDSTVNHLDCPLTYNDLSNQCIVRWLFHVSWTQQFLQSCHYTSFAMDTLKCQPMCIKVIWDVRTFCLRHLTPVIENGFCIRSISYNLNLHRNFTIVKRTYFFIHILSKALHIYSSVPPVLHPDVKLRLQVSTWSFGRQIRNNSECLLYSNFFIRFWNREIASKVFMSGGLISLWRQVDNIALNNLFILSFHISFLNFWNTAFFVSWFWSVCLDIRFFSFKKSPFSYKLQTTKTAFVVSTYLFIFTIFILDFLTYDKDCIHSCIYTSTDKIFYQKSKSLFLTFDTSYTRSCVYMNGRTNIKSQKVPFFWNLIQMLSIPVRRQME